MAAPTDRMLIVGAGALAESAVRYLASGSDRVRIIGFVDDDNFKFGKVVHGRPILGSIDDLEVILARTWFNQILIATEGLPEERMAAVWELATRHRIAVHRFAIGLSEMVSAPPGGMEHSASIPSMAGRPAVMDRI